MTLVTNELKSIHTIMIDGIEYDMAIEIDNQPVEMLKSDWIALAKRINDYATGSFSEYHRSSDYEKIREKVEKIEFNFRFNEEISSKDTAICGSHAELEPEQYSLNFFDGAGKPIVIDASAKKTGETLPDILVLYMEMKKNISLAYEEFRNKSRIFTNISTASRPSIKNAALPALAPTKTFSSTDGTSVQINLTASKNAPNLDPVEIVKNNPLQHPLEPKKPSKKDEQFRNDLGLQLYSLTNKKRVIDFVKEEKQIEQFQQKLNAHLATAVCTENFEAIFPIAQRIYQSYCESYFLEIFQFFKKKQGQATKFGEALIKSSSLKCTIEAKKLIIAFVKDYVSSGKNLFINDVITLLKYSNFKDAYKDIDKVSVLTLKGDGSSKESTIYIKPGICQPSPDKTANIFYDGGIGEFLPTNLFQEEKILRVKAAKEIKENSTNCS